ncbi:hypothetical protein PV336_06325 [Streptomyces sp. MI02-2A]|uniref:hypothetical protein n=1 Tax=unclassified Streptomyces TaxID=2593676 RepID=UPI00131B49BC|nr:MULTISPECIES: hypothetical protein [unclassified Streptomyces]MDX3258847.1 hypothetical protein [Streptomyces sp. MI02-2A]
MRQDPLPHLRVVHEGVGEQFEVGISQQADQLRELQGRGVPVVAVEEDESVDRLGVVQGEVGRDGTRSVVADQNTAIDSQLSQYRAEFGLALSGMMRS